MVCRHQVADYRPHYPQGPALVRLSELRAALPRRQHQHQLQRHSHVELVLPDPCEPQQPIDPARLRGLARLARPHVVAQQAGPPAGTELAN